MWLSLALIVRSRFARSKYNVSISIVPLMMAVQWNTSLTPDHALSNDFGCFGCQAFFLHLVFPKAAGLWCCSAGMWSPSQIPRWTKLWNPGIVQTKASSGSCQLMIYSYRPYGFHMPCVDDMWFVLSRSSGAMELQNAQKFVGWFW